jgi:hypothetical protein
MIICLSHENTFDWLIFILFIQKMSFFFECFDHSSILEMQSEHDGSDIQVEFNVEHHEGEDIVPNMTKSPRVKYITYYEDSKSITGKRTAVWEIDKGAFEVFGLLMNRVTTLYLLLWLSW